MRKGPYGPLSFAVATRFIGQFVADSGTNTIQGSPAIYSISNELGTLQHLCLLTALLVRLCEINAINETGTMNVLSLSRFRYLARIGKVSGLV